ncbi:diacylglycerol kinase family protein [Rubripirellula amarantea]|nr:diacylglycerol kinase family protein [Rubripirellula amarantea]
MPLPSVVLFTSPKAGSGKNRDQIDRLISRLRQANNSASVTANVAELDALLRQTVKPIVVAAGGDGTIGLVASRLAVLQTLDNGAPARLIPMPMGTENLLARQFGFRADADYVFDKIYHGHSTPIDLGFVGQKPFLSMVTCGFDGEVIRAMHLTRRGHIRRFDYWRPILRAIRHYRFPPIMIEAEGVPPSDDSQEDDVGGNDSTRTIQCGWAMAFNLPVYAGGMTIEPHAKPNDGLLDVIAFQGRSILSGLRYVAGIRLGRHLEFPDVVRFRATTLRVHSSHRVPFQLDGDYGGKLPIEIRVEPSAIELLV